MFELMNIDGDGVGFDGVVRGGDEQGRDVFKILLNEDLLYGYYVREFSENRNDFNIAVMGFGYLFRENVGNPSLDARRLFSADEVLRIKYLVNILFLDPVANELRQSVGMFSRKKSSFLGVIRFSDGWVRLK